MKAGDFEPDRFYYDQALQIIQSEKRRSAAVHFRLHHVQPLSLVEHAPARADAGLAEHRQRSASRRISPPAMAQRARLHRFQATACRRISPGVVPDRSLRRSSAGNGEDHRSRRHRGGGFAADHGARSALLHDLLRHRCDQLPAEGCVLGARPAGSALSAAAGSGGGRTCRSIPRLPSKRKSWSAATGCFSNARAAPRPGASTAC